MAHLQENEWFKAVGPDNIILPYPTSSYLQSSQKQEKGEEGEIWFDWAFVDF
jgi:intracellular protein transport protein USO1